MKGKLLTGYSQDLQRTIVAGTEVEILESWCGIGGSYYRCQLSDDSQITLSDKQIVITDRTPPVDWNKVRIQASIAAMQAILSDDRRTGTIEEMAFASVEYADALIEELKKEGNNDKGRGGRVDPADEGE